MATHDFSSMEVRSTTALKRKKEYPNLECFKAFSYVKSCRKDIDPNRGFTEQLNSWTTKIEGLENLELICLDYEVMKNREKYLPKTKFNVNLCGEKSIDLEVRLLQFTFFFFN